MSSVPSFLRLPSEDNPANPAPESFGLYPNPSLQSAVSWRPLLSPQIEEKAVLISDLVLIVSAGLGCSLLYHLATNADAARAKTFVGVGLLVAFNFALLMTTRRDHSLKTLVARALHGLIKYPFKQAIAPITIEQQCGRPKLRLIGALSARQAALC
jgi:hypothetical protein